MSEPPLARRLQAGDAVLAASIGAAALALYLSTLQPDFGGPEDAPKFQFLGYVLGTAHPPGYPLYSLLSHLFVMLPLRTIAYRANLFSAVMAALACAIAVAVARQIGATRWSAACAALALGTGASFWRNALFAEVYSLGAVMAGLTVVLLLAWSASGGTVRLLAAVAAFGLGLGNHLTIIGLLPAATLFVIWRDRRVLTFRVVVATAATLLLCVSQYGFIVIRTWQQAPYLESRAQSLAELWSVVTAERFAGERFAFSPVVLATVQVPAVLSVVAREVGIFGALLFAAGLVVTVVTRNAAAALVSGAALGMLAMVVNLSGDLKGFITPVVVLLWPLVALGADTIRKQRISSRAVRTAVSVFAMATMALIPVSNVMGNHAEVDRSGESEQGRLFRNLFAQLPDRAAVVAEDYFFDMALHYYMFTREGGPDRGITPIPFSPAAVHEAARHDRRVFAFGRAASFLGADGLYFERAPIAGPLLGDWLKTLPRGTVVAGAAAYSAVPLELSTFDRQAPSDLPRTRPFSAFALETRRWSRVMRQADEGLSLPVDERTFASFLPLPGTLVAVADTRGARVELGGRAIASVDRGIVLGVFKPDGALWRALEFVPGAPVRVDPEAALYELKAESRCVAINAVTWTDVAPALSTGSSLTTVPAPGALTLETELPASCGTNVRVAEMLGAGAVRQVSKATNSNGAITLVSELTRGPYGRPLFRLALDCVPGSARARIQSGGTASTVTMCANRPPALFASDTDRAVLRPDFEAEVYFGGGWHDAERTPTGRVRRAGDRATLLLPLEPGYRYEISLDLFMSVPAHLNATFNGVSTGSCDVGGATTACDLVLSSERVIDGVNALTLTTTVRSPSSDAPSLTFQGARIVRRLER